MSLRIIFILFLAVPYISAAKIEAVDQIVRSLSARMSWNHHWSNEWDLDKLRRVRCVALDGKNWLIAIEVFPGDFPKSETIQWQVACVRLSGHPRIDFSVMPLSPKVINVFGINITESQRDSLLTGKGSIEKQFKASDFVRRYSRGMIWEKQFEGVRRSLLEDLHDLKFKRATILIHNLLPEDEAIEGLVLLDDKEVYDVSGEIFYREGVDDFGQCVLRLSKKQHVDVWRLDRLADSMVVFKVKKEDGMIVMALSKE